MEPEKSSCSPTDRPTKVSPIPDSSLEIHLGNGVSLVDAGGYPLNRLNATTISIPTGQLLAGTAKHFVMTFTIPNAAVGSVELGDLRLNYSVQGKARQTSIEPSNLKLAVVAPELRQQALKSIDKDVYQQSWLDINLGIVKKKISEFVRSGNQPAAKKAINEFRREIKAAEQGVKQNRTAKSMQYEGIKEQRKSK